MDFKGLMENKGLMEKWIMDVEDFGSNSIFNLEKFFTIIRYQAYRNTYGAQMDEKIIKQMDEKMSKATSSMNYCPLALGSRL